MEYAVEMTSDGKVYISSFTNFRNLEVIWGGERYKHTAK
jgi:hypothetical protein